jgi:AraC-like DNA-binding protein
MGGVGGWAAPEKDALLIILSEAGRSQFAQDHRSVELAPGDLLIRDLAKSWIHRGQGEMRMLMVKIPYTALLSRVDDPARLLGTSLSSDRPAVALAADVIRAIDRTLTAEPDAAWSATLAELMLDSVTMIYQSMPDLAAWQSGWQQRAGFRRDAKAFILRHLDDPELSVATIAAALGVGQRRLQRAFVEAGETPSQFILAQRLDRAAALLCKAKGPSRNSILDIALSVGFNDASHFSRTFSRRFGVSPRRYCGTPPLE